MLKKAKIIRGRILFYFLMQKFSAEGRGELSNEVCNQLRYVIEILTHEREIIHLHLVLLSS
jgi:hypothetical protein